MVGRLLWLWDLAYFQLQAVSFREGISSLTKVNIFDIDTENRRAVQEFLTTDYVSWRIQMREGSFRRNMFEKDGQTATTLPYLQNKVWQVMVTLVLK